MPHTLIITCWYPYCQGVDIRVLIPYSSDDDDRAKQRGRRRVKTIRQLREERDWTRLDLAFKLGVTPGTIYNWERGANEPKATQLRALAEAFGVSMDEIDLGYFTEGKDAA